MTIPRLALLALLAAGCLAGCGSTEPKGNTRPEDAKIITSDIANFWVGFDSITSPSDTLPLRRYYLDKGTVGLTDFTNLRWKNSLTLTGAVWTRKSYYASIRANTLKVLQIEPQVRQVFAVLDTLVPGSIFPDVYFEIGAMGTGGTTSDNGLLIGTELFSVAPDSPLGTLTAWQQSVVRPADVLPGIVAHELTHYQQKMKNVNSLLAQSIREGSADFLGLMLSGKTINDSLRAYGFAHEAALWAEFQTQMNGSDISNWLYNGGTVTAVTRPADLGYFIGARICDAYYAKATDKRQAIRDILTISDFPKFLAASGYSPK